MNRWCTPLQMLAGVSPPCCEPLWSFVVSRAGADCHSWQAEAAGVSAHDAASLSTRQLDQQTHTHRNLLTTLRSQMLA